MIGILIAENPVHDSDCKAALSINHSVAMTVTNPMAELVGPGFIGFVFCLSLYGVTMAQTTLYYRRFPASLICGSGLVPFCHRLFSYLLAL